MPLMKNFSRKQDFQLYVIVGSRTWPYLCIKLRLILVPSYISDLFSYDMSRYNLGNIDDFSLPRCNTVTYGRHSLRYMGPYIWSKLHKSIKMADSLTAFKN